MFRTTTDKTRQGLAVITAAIAMSLAGVPDTAHAQTLEPGTFHEAPDPHRQAYFKTIELLDSEGYLITFVGHSWLNRIIIRAKKGDIRREIVISQSTGLVLRDVVFGIE